MIHTLKARNKCRKKHQYYLKLGTGKNILFNNYHDILKIFFFNPSRVEPKLKEFGCIYISL